MALPEIETRFTADTTQFDQGVQRVGQGLDKATQQTVKTSRAMSGQFRGAVQNAAFQMQDFAVQVQMGTSASRALSMQLPQLLGGFGAVGAVVGLVAGVTIPLLATAFSDAESEVVKFDDALKGIEDVASRLDQSAKLLELSIYELGEAYGVAALRVREFTLEQAELRVALAENELRDQINTLDEVIRRYTALSSSGNLLSQDMDELARTLGLTTDQALELQNSFGRLSQARTFTAQQQELLRILRLMNDYNIALSDIPPELAAALDQFIELSNEADAARAIMQRIAELTGEGTTGLGMMADEAARLATNLASAASQSIGNVFQGAGNILGEVGGWLGFGEDEAPSGGARVSTRGGGGGGGASVRDPRIMALIESLQTERETIESWYAESQALLEEANQQELAIIGGYNDAKLRLAQEYQDRLAEIQQQGAAESYAIIAGAGAELLGNIAGNNEKILKAQQAFAVAEATINAARAAAQIWASPELPFLAKIAAAAKVAAAFSGIFGVLNSPKASGGGGGGSVGGGAAANANSAPLQVFLNPIDPSALFTGGQVNSLLDQIQKEAGDRGFRIVGGGL